MVQIMRGHNFVFNTFVVVLKAMLGVITLKHKKVFNLELIIFVPPDPQTILLAFLCSRFLNF